MYTFILKDHIPYQNPENGRERASLSWEVDFSVSQSEVTSQTTTIFFKWEAFEPTYRGKKQSRKHGPDLRKVKRFSIMMRRFAPLFEPCTNFIADQEQLLRHAGRRISLDSSSCSSGEGHIRRRPNAQACHSKPIYSLRIRTDREPGERATEPQRRQAGQSVALAFAPWKTWKALRRPIDGLQCIFNLLVSFPHSAARCGIMDVEQSVSTEFCELDRQVFGNSQPCRGMSALQNHSYEHEL